MAPVDNGRRRRGAVNPDWSQLHPDLLVLIVGRIIRRSDFITFRSVCHRWRSAADPKLLRPQPPLLLLPRDPSSDTCTFFSITSRELREIHLPTVAGERIISAAHGWLVLLDDSTERVLSLLNPVTGATMRLPPTHGFRPPPSSRFWIPTLLSSPGSDDCFVIVRKCYWEANLVAFCRPGEDQRWTAMTTNTWQCIPCESCLYDDGRFFAVDNLFGELHICGPAAAPGNPVEMPALKFRPHPRGIFHLVKTGEGLFLCSLTNADSSCYRFRVFKSKLSGGGGVQGWSEVDSIGSDEALFHSRYETLACSDLKDFPELRKDCIYTMMLRPASSCSSSKDVEEQTCGIYVFDLKEKIYERISCGVNTKEGILKDSYWVILNL